MVAYSGTLNARFRSGKVNAKKRNLAWNLTKEEYATLIASNECHYCNQPLPKMGYGLDRKNNEDRYDSKTAVPCCTRCNRAFQDFFDHDEKLILAERIREIDRLRAEGIS